MNFVNFQPFAKVFQQKFLTYGMECARAANLRNYFNEIFKNRYSRKCRPSKILRYTEFYGFSPPCLQHDQALLEEEKQLLEEEKILLEERVKELTLQIEKYKKQQVRKGGWMEGRKQGWREGQKGGRGGRERGEKDGQTDNRMNVFNTCIAAYMYHNLILAF